jgi:hypothetical protein
MVNREYIESLSVENARCLMRAISATYGEIVGDDLSIAQNVTSCIESTLAAGLDQETSAVY